jgi:hypothetical protein
MGGYGLGDRMSGPITPPLTVTEVDGAPSGRPITTIKVSNGDLTISGNVATIDTTGSGGTPGGSDTEIQYNDGGAFGGDAGFIISTAGGDSTTLVDIGGMRYGGTGYGAQAITLNGTVSLVAEGTGQVILRGAEDAGGTWSDTIVNVMSSANTDDAQLKFRDSINADNGTITLNGSGDMVLSNSVANKDIDLHILGTGQVEIENQTTNNGTTLSVKGNGTGNATINLNNPSKAVSLICDTNKKLKIQGGTDTFVFDASSATGGITWPDGTTQTTASSGGGGISGPLGPSPSDIGDGSGFMQIGTQAGWGGLLAENCWIATFPILHPFISQETGDLASMTVNVKTAITGVSGEFGIYDDSDGSPNSLLGSATIDLSSTGEITQTTLSDTITLTRGTQYWIAHTQSAGTGNAFIDGIEHDKDDTNSARALSVEDTITSHDDQNSLVLASFAATTSLPATITLSDYRTDGRARPNVGLKW